jgi:hypothetical protein
MKTTSAFLCSTAFCVFILSLLFTVGKVCFPHGLFHPTITSDQVTVTMGKIENDTPIPCSFQVKNVGYVPLEIFDVAPICGSIGFIQVTAFPNKKLDPNETGTIDVLFLPANLKGKVQKAIVVRTNDPYSPNFPMSLTASVEINNTGGTWTPTLAP